MAFAISVEKMPRPLQVDMCGLEMEMVVEKLLALTIQLKIMEAIKGRSTNRPADGKIQEESSRREMIKLLCVGR